MRWALGALVACVHLAYHGGTDLASDSKEWKRRRKIRRAFWRLREPIGRKSARYRRLAVFLDKHHGSSTPSFFQTLTEMTSRSWECAYCKIMTNGNAAWCRSCGGHWTDVTWKGEVARGRRRTRRSKSRLEVSQGKQLKGQQDPLAPFSGGRQGEVGGITPWTATTPQSRVVKLEVGAIGQSALPPSPVLPLPPTKIEKEAAPSSATPAVAGVAESARTHLEALKKAMGNSLPEEIESQLKVAIDKTNSARAITHGHLHRVTNAQKSLEKSKQAVKDLDAQWKAFTSNFQERWTRESQAYGAKRSAAMEQVSKARARLAEAQEALQKAATVPVTPEMEEEELMTEEQLQTLMESQCPVEPEGGMQSVSDAEDQSLADIAPPTSKALRPFAQGSSSPKRRALGTNADKKWL